MVNEAQVRYNNSATQQPQKQVTLVSCELLPTTIVPTSSNTSIIQHLTKVDKLFRSLTIKQKLLETNDLNLMIIHREQFFVPEG
jgi:hypothetical protein